MESAIWVITVLVVLVGALLIGVLLRMIIKGDYSLGAMSGERRRFPGALDTRRDSLDLEVVHFVKETACWTSEAEQKRAEDELRELRLRSWQN